MRIEFYRHNLDEADIQNVVSVLGSVFLTTGPKAAQFEHVFAAYTGLEHVVPLSSCTAALHLALTGLGVGPGDEVIVPAMTFLATASSVLHAGATPVLVDVDPATGLIDPQAVERAVTPRTKAVIPVHLYGVLADMPAIKAVADRHGLFVIEDSAHCVEGERHGVRPGHLGHCACYSFYATKNLTCGEGGALATNDPDLAAKVRQLALHGMSKGAADRYHGLYRHWDWVTLGWKFNLDDIRAALLIHQIDRLDALWAVRHALYRRYAQAVVGHAGITIPAVVGKSAHHIFTIQVAADRRDAILQNLQERGLGVAVNFRAIHTLTYLRETLGLPPEQFPVAKRIGDCTITLPFYPKLTADEIDHILASVLAAVEDR